MKLTLADEQHIRDTEGWLELGDVISAFKALEEIDPQHRAHPKVLRLRWQIYAKAKKWSNAFTVAEGLTRVAPSEVLPFVWRSYSARRMKGGSVAQAFELLRDVSDDFPDEPLVAFNGACYLCQVGRLDEARTWLQRCFVAAEKSGEAKTYRRRAGDEPDLEPLRKK